LSNANKAGSQSRIAFNFEKLREADWTIKQGERESFLGVNVYSCYLNPGGKTKKAMG